ncbi:MAG: glycerol acyltransferase [Bacteroidaceae bacterium]|nr:glycerol acyltransferase [Bacteroidaceae bacterium]
MVVENFKIDIDQILESKMGKKARYVPKFLSNWLKKIVHQDQINAFIEQEGDKQGVEWIEDCLAYLDTKVCVEGIEHLPDAAKTECCTFVSNHPLGGLDGLALGAVLGKHYEGKVKYLVNDLLMNLHGLAPLFVPINKTGRQGRNFPAMVEAAFSSNNHIIMFPAGLCSRRINGEITDLEWKKTFITKSVQTQRDVVPIYFEGRNSDFFYKLANACKALGIKFNIAMLFLADEMFKNQHNTFTVKIGKPIPWQTFDKSKTPTEWAQYVKTEVYKMRDEA